MAVSILKESDFRKELRAAVTGGYVFFGEEDYMKSAALRMARQSVAEAAPAMAAFNDVHIDGLDFTTAALLDAMAVPPMGGDRKVITVTGLNFNALRAAELDRLCEALGELRDYPYNLVIFSAAADGLDYGTLPKKPSELLTTLGEYLRPVYFERNTPAKLAGWVQKHYLHNGVQASPAVCQFTVEYCGRNMFTLSGEIDKVSFYVRAKGRDTATEEDVRTAAIPTMEYDAFAFTNAIGARKREEALNILRDLKLRKTDPIIIMSEITRTVCDMAAITALKADGLTAREIASALKIHEYRVSIVLNNNLKPDVCMTMLERCRDADLELKRSADGYAALERLICTI